MTIEEAIKHQRCMAEKYKYKLVLNETGNPMFSLGNREIPRIEKYVEEYEQVASWLEELKAKRKMLDFLFEVINPNDMEDYMRIYNSTDKKVDGGENDKEN